VVVLALAVAVVAVTGAGAAKPRPKPIVPVQSNTYPPLNYSAYVGGKGKARGAPITIGWINGQGGPPTMNFPQGTRVAEAAVKMINAELGGVHGHPLKLDECFIAQAEEEGQKCGQQMANNPAIKVVEVGVMVVGNQSYYNVIKASKPTIFGVSANNLDATAKNVYLLIGSSNSVLGMFGRYTKLAYPKAKTAIVAYANQPGADVAAGNLAKSYTAVGIKASLLAYSATATDLVGPATEAQKADVIVASCGFVDCPLFAKALSQIGSTKPVVTPPLVTFLPPQAFPGGDYPKWDVGVAQSFTKDPTDPQIKLYLKKATQYGASAADQQSVFAELAWTQMLALTRVLNQIPYARLSPVTISAQMKKFTGPLVMAAPTIACGKVDPTQPAACGNQAQFYRYTGNNVWKKTSGYLGPPPAKKGK
jgi:branched-chain amino acid transport system substrate-binding protein